MISRYLRVLARHPRPFRFVVARFLVQTGLCKHFTIAQEGYRLRFHPANLSTNIWIDPTSREEVMTFFRAYLKPGDKSIDVGANIGDTVLTSSLQVGDDGHVTGIEAHPRTYSYLADNINLNQAGNVTLIHSAAGDQKGTVKFSDSRYADMNQVNHGNLEVPVNPLDDLISNTDSIALLKIDVEGYELPVFRGAKRVLSQTECIYFEVGEKMCSDFGYTPKDLLAEVASHGFHLLVHEAGDQMVTLQPSQSFNPYRNGIACRDVGKLRSRTGWVMVE